MLIRQTHARIHSHVKDVWVGGGGVWGRSGRAGETKAQTSTFSPITPLWMCCAASCA